MKEPPEIELITKGEHVVLGTHSGIFWHGEAEVLNDELEVGADAINTAGALPRHRENKEMGFSSHESRSA